MPGEVGLCGGGKVAELTLERSLACVGEKKTKGDETRHKMHRVNQVVQVCFA